MYGQSAVMWNIAGGGPSTLSALIQRGYKLGKRDLLDNTELHRVTMVGHGKYIADLLAAGADPLARNYEGLRPLDVLQISFGVPDFVCSDESLRRGVGLILNDSRPYAHMYAHLFSATLRAEQALLAGQKKAPAQSATPSP